MQIIPNGANWAIKGLKTNVMEYDGATVHIRESFRILGNPNITKLKIQEVKIYT